MNKDSNYYLHLNYNIIIEHIAEDDTFLAYHNEFGKGSCYGIGNTEVEAIAALKEDKKAFIELLIAEKKEIPLPETRDDVLPSGQIILRMPRTLHKELKEIAVKERVSLNQYLLSVLSKNVGNKNSLTEIAGRQ